MHHGQNRETKQRKLSKRHKLNEERGKSLNLVKIGGICKMHHWLKLGDGSLCLEEGIKVGGIWIKALRFACDQTMIARSQRGLQTMNDA